MKTASAFLEHRPRLWTLLMRGPPDSPMSLPLHLPSLLVMPFLMTC